MNIQNQNASFSNSTHQNNKKGQKSQNSKQCINNLAKIASNSSTTDKANFTLPTNF